MNYCNMLSEHGAIILLVDDVPQNIQVLGEILKQRGYSFAIATSGAETFQVLEKCMPDLILLDIMLPDTDGFEICKQLKQNQKTSDIPIIFLTALTELDDKIRGFESGAVDYITKPFEAVEVIARVRTHILLKRSMDIIRKCYDDIEKEKRLLEIMAITDELTGIFNRRHILNRLNEEIRRARRHQIPIAVVMSDIDHFKDINDSYGHQVGDNVLKKIVDTMKTSLREIDLIGRYGGEEFLIVLPETHLKNAFQAAERMRKKIEQLRWEQKEMRITISCGIAEFLHQEKDFELLKRADDMLYSAKEKGRNRIQF